MVLQIATAMMAFGLALLTLTYSTALVADVTGYFRLLFIERPYQQAFRLLRWLVAGVAALSVFAAIQ